MIAIGIISVVFMWIVIASCYWSPKTKKQKKIQIPSKYNKALSPTLSTTLLVEHNDSTNNDKGDTLKFGKNDSTGLI